MMRKLMSKVGAIVALETVLQTKESLAETEAERWLVDVVVVVMVKESVAAVDAVVVVSGALAIAMDELMMRSMRQNQS